MKFLVPLLSVTLLLHVTGEPLPPGGHNKTADSLQLPRREPKLGDTHVNLKGVEPKHLAAGAIVDKSMIDKNKQSINSNVIKPKSFKKRRRKKNKSPLKQNVAVTNKESIPIHPPQDVNAGPKDLQQKAAEAAFQHQIQQVVKKAQQDSRRQSAKLSQDKNIQDSSNVKHVNQNLGIPVHLYTGQADSNGKSSLVNNMHQEVHPEPNQGQVINNMANQGQVIHNSANQAQGIHDSASVGQGINSSVNQDQGIHNTENVPKKVGDISNGALNENRKSFDQVGESLNNFQANINSNSNKQPVDTYNNNNNVNFNNNNNIVNVNNNNMNANSGNVYSNNNNMNFNNNGNMQQPINVINEQTGDQSRKEDSLKIVWDWSDFLINYEQYVMPEQKNRRAPHATAGEPWPLPQYYVAKSNKVYKIEKDKFRFQITKESCDIIEKAIVRYREMIIEDTVPDMYSNLQHARGTSIKDVNLKYEDDTYIKAQPISVVNIKIRRPCAKFPNEQMDESYDVFVKKTGSYIWANEVWGALRGLETFSQIVFRGPDDVLYIKDTVINDYPRFPHRGLLVDSSRHFIFKEVIYDILEGLAQNKMNVMHWHIVDDQSFPYQSKTFPEMSEKGAYHPSFVYTQEDIADIIEYARMRGIRVMPEFDTPGHTYAWGLSHPELLTQCYQGSHPVSGYLGPLDPSKNQTYRFLKTLFKEVMHTFTDQYIHLGGDEVPMTCWSSNPEVLQLLNKLNGKPDEPINLQNVDPYMYSYDIRKVLEYYEQRLTNDLKDLGRNRKNGVRFVMWQEIMNNNIQLPNDTIIQIWQGDMGDVQRAIDMGYQALYSTCWYLDLIEYGTKWPKYYNCDPADSSMGYQIDEKRILGGEAALWAEYIDNENLMTTLWPRASAAAERLWSSKDVRDVEAAGRRLQEHRCRMLSRGLAVGQISGPDYCLRRGHRRDGERAHNCTGDRCHTFRNSVQIEKINWHVQQRGRSIAECNQMLANGGNLVAIILLILILAAVLFSLKMSGSRIVQIKVCRNKSIFLSFITLIVIYFMCYTSIWMQVQEFRGSFEKRIKSYSDGKIT